MWTSFDLHRFVAHYMSIRFPICLALNKIDALPDTNGLEIGGNIQGLVVDKGVIQLCQHQAINRGELAMPVSAFAETWEILKQANTKTKACMNTSSLIHAHAAMEQSEERYSDPGDVKDNDVLQSEKNTVPPLTSNDCKTDHAEVQLQVQIVEEEVEEKKKEVKAFIPVEGSAAWMKNEAVLEKVKRLWNTTGAHCTVLYCTVMYCTVLYCNVLCCTVLYCTVSGIHLCIVLTIELCGIIDHYHNPSSLLMISTHCS